MKQVHTFLSTLVFLGQAFLAALVGYLLLLTGAAWTALARRKASTPLLGMPIHRFLFLIPAHNEARLLGTTLDNLAELDYPRNRYAVHVVADNCTDATADIARAHGVEVHERFNDELRGKGYALQWLLEHLWERQEPHDAVVILDADSVVSPNFLRVMDARLARGERVIQAYYAVRDPGSAWSVSLRYAALAVLHYLRPLGRMVLGGSTGLKGNGMVFAADVMREHEWTAHLTEDIEFHMALVMDGERVGFAPDARVEAEMPVTLEGAQTQNVRWERGRLEMARQFVPRLLREAGTGRSNHRFLLFDAAMEHLIPPFSILAGATAALSGAALGLLALRRTRLSRLNAVLGVGLIAGQVAYVLSGLRMVRAPRAVYTSLLRAPFFVAWKLWLYVRVLLGRDRDGWIRTRRNDEG